MQKNSDYPEKVINSFNKGITLSPPILLNLRVYSNPVRENTEQRKGYIFLSKKPAFPYLNYSLKNKQPEEASNEAECSCFYMLSSKPGSAQDTGSGSFSGTGWRPAISVTA